MKELFKNLNVLSMGLTLCFFLLTTVGFSAVEVYPRPGDLNPSDKYSLAIEQGGVSYPSFVYKTTSRNDADHTKNLLTYLYKSTDPATSSFSTFSFNNAVEVRVTKLEGKAESVRIKPSRFGITARLEGNTAVFTLNKPTKVSVEFNECVTHSMLVFADAPEVNVPKQGDPGVKYFGPGIYDIGEVNPIASNTTVYIAGGAYVQGMFQGNDVQNVTIRGRGVMSGEKWPWAKAVDKNGNMIQKEHHHENMFGARGSNFYVEGVTIAGNPHYALRMGGNNHTIKNVKIISWWGSTDGIGTGESSLIEDCFVKVNDDHIKLYNPNLTIRNIILWPYISGAPFQFGYNPEMSHGGKTHVSNIDVINDGLGVREGNNRGILCASGTAYGSDFVFENIWIEGPIYRFIKLDGGNISRVTLKNIFLTQPPTMSNIAIGTHTDWTVTNMIVAGKPALKYSDAFFTSPSTPKNIQFFYNPDSMSVSILPIRSGKVLQKPEFGIPRMILPFRGLTNSYSGKVYTVSGRLCRNSVGFLPVVQVNP